MKPDYLFEVSWEACNKVGGIYTVIKSKADLMNKEYKNYFLIGPYFEDKAKVDLEEEEPPTELATAFKELKQEGLKFHYGKWQIKGEPRTILIDFTGMTERKNEIKTKYWDDYKIDSLNSGWDFEEPLIWCWAVSRLLRKIAERSNKKIVGHFHEWLSGGALLYTKDIIKTVFTTHATMLGRTLAGSGQDLYSILDKINPEEQAYKHGVQDKFTMERAAATNAHIFTTVSEITALEAEKILGRKAEVLVLNGLDAEKFPTIEDTSIKHVTRREKIREFLTFFFFPYYTFNLEKNLILFIVGRYEFRNKGVDILINALGELNKKLKKEKTERTVSVFFWIPTGTKGLKVEILENKSYYRHIKNFIAWHSDAIQKKIVSDLISKKDINQGNLFTKEFMLRVRKDLLHFKREGLPPLTTHNLDEDNDPIIQNFKKEGLTNKEEDKVKVIFYPVYLNGNDEMINLPYYDAMSGGHLGIFPSYYEPWGYTPLESAALGTPALTSDLSGFGKFLQSQGKGKEGIYVLERQNKTTEEVQKQFVDLIYKFIMLSHHDRIHQKIVAKKTSELADWNILVKNYFKAHQKALEK